MLHIILTSKPTVAYLSLVNYLISSGEDIRVHKSSNAKIPLSAEDFLMALNSSPKCIWVDDNLIPEITDLANRYQQVIKKLSDFPGCHDATVSNLGDLNG